MKRMTLAVILMLFPLTALAGEKVSGTNFLVSETDNWQTGENSGYWVFEGTGVSHSPDSVFGTEAIECHGAGFWDESGTWGEGICLHGDGDDTRTSSWKRDQGKSVGHWKLLSGTGKYAGIAGQGTFRPTQLSGGRTVSEWEGEITLAE
ncbi:MAG: hypothetical protein GY791_17570 [Alphaproteobacteria bacterium]|nr:hypothetical protein [Alphaproteobacteria bacterium]